jgi:predicted MFS family arabinose efflux permease
VLVASGAAVGADGSVLRLVLQDIKIDLALSDTQLGFLTGIAFAVFYCVMGIPLARWADRGNRVVILALTMALWGVTMVLCGSAANFSQLLLARIGVAVGEAGCNAPANSLIPDYFTRAQRPRAVAIYMMGFSLGIGLGYSIAGWANESYGWRATFVIIGLPGLALAALARFTLREPRRAQRTANIDEQRQPRAHPLTESDRQLPLKEVWKTLWRIATFRQLLGCWIIISFLGAGIAQWQPAFFIRSFGFSTGQLGMWFALIYGAGTVLGTYWGGELASRYAANDERRQFKAMAVLYSSFGVLSAATYLSPSYQWALALIGISSVMGALAIGPLFATLQSLVPERMRATAVALIYLFSNLIGMGLGPLAVGMLSDALQPLLGEHSLRYALLALCPGYAWGGWYLWRASRSVQGDLAADQSSRRISTVDNDLGARAHP